MSQKKTNLASTGNIFTCQANNRIQECSQSVATQINTYTVASWY